MKKKTLALLLVLVMIFGISVGGTIAYLTDSKTVTNTFTVGDVKIKLDEAKVDEAGNKIDYNGDKVIDDKDRVEGTADAATNTYKLIPGMSYTKDPKVTVLEGSEKSYVRMLVTVSKSAELDTIFSPSGADMTAIFGTLGTGWVYKNNAEDTAANTRTYEFWYNTEVDDKSNIPALFETITVPGAITNAQLKTLDTMSITVVAHAIQSASFVDKDGKTAMENAWAAWTVNN